MRTGIAIITVLVLAAAAIATPRGSIVSSFRSPSPSVYGIDYIEEALFHADGGYTDYIYLTTRTGSIIRSYLLPPQIDAVDLDRARAYMYASNYNRRIFTMTTTGSLLNSWNGPSGPCYGIASDGTYIWVSALNRIYRYYGNGSLISSFTGPWPNLRGIDYSSGYLWLADRGSSTGGAIYQVTITGSVVTSFYQAGHNPVGVAFDQPYIWYTDEKNNYVYQMTYSMTSETPATLGRIKAIYK